MKVEIHDTAVNTVRMFDVRSRHKINHAVKRLKTNNIEDMIRSGSVTKIRNHADNGEFYVYRIDPRLRALLELRNDTFNVIDFATTSRIKRLKELS